jgi:hypothetical protein
VGITDQAVKRARGERPRVPLCLTLARAGQINDSPTETEYFVVWIERLRLLSRTINKNYTTLTCTHISRLKSTNIYRSRTQLQSFFLECVILLCCLIRKQDFFFLLRRHKPWFCSKLLLNIINPYMFRVLYESKFQVEPIQKNINKIYSMTPYPWVIHSKAYRGYVKPRIIPNAIYNVTFV